MVPPTEGQVVLTLADLTPRAQADVAAYADAGYVGWLAVAQSGLSPPCDPWFVDVVFPPVVWVGAEP